MFSFIKKLFSKANRPVKVKLSETVDITRSLAFDVVLGFDVEVDPIDYTVCLQVNRVTLLSNNEGARRYVDNVDNDAVRRTISMLCTGASQYILNTTKDFVKSPTKSAEEPPTVDKTFLN